MLCHTALPDELVPPPIKRSKILVSDGVVVLLLVKLYLWLLNVRVWLRRLWLRVLTEIFLFPDIPQLEQKVALCTANKASVATNFRLSPSTFLFPQIMLRSTLGFDFGFLFVNCFKSSGLKFVFSTIDLGPTYTLFPILLDLSYFTFLLHYCFASYLLLWLIRGCFTFFSSLQ